MCPCDRSDFLTGNFNHKFCSTCCAFRINDDFCLPRSFLKFVFSLFRTFNISRDERVQNRLLWSSHIH